jgi:hypothetical protein
MPREKREAGARGGAGAKKRARTPAAGASSRRARDREASERRLDHDDADANASSFPPSTLPPEVLDVILSLLDHDSAFQCALVCRAWRDVALAPDSAAARRLLADVVRANAGILAEADALAARAPETGHPDPLRGDALARWETCRARELRLLLAAREMTTSGGPGGNTNHRTTTTETSTTTATTTTTSPRQLYADVCAFACYDCREMRDALDPAPRAPRTTAGTLRVRLCVTCSGGYAGWRPTGQRLVTATAAKERYGLRPADLAGFRYGLDTNPVDPGFAPMKLYRRTDTRAAAMARWGSGEALEAELRKRMLGDR